MPEMNPIRETDDEARALARGLIDDARFGAIAYTDPDAKTPAVSRVAIATTQGGQPMTLISELSHHTKALRADTSCALLLGEPGPKGDPLTHPRVTLHATARFVPRSDEAFPALREHYLGQHPKSKLYIDFADFGIVVFEVSRGDLNGGFGKAFNLTAADLGL